MPDAHALLAPSAAKRWMACPPSALLEAGMPGGDTDYTREGTLAHKLAELLLERLRDGLLGGLDAEGVVAYYKAQLQGDGLDADLSVCYAEALRNEWDFWEMLATVWEDYVLLVWADFTEMRSKGMKVSLEVEVKLDLSQFIPEGFGSADAVIAGGRTLKVYDLKYGKGVRVDADHNPQIMCYGLGALLAFDFLATDRIEMNIIQPRLHHSSRFEMTCEELIQWGFHELHPAAVQAYTGEGEYKPGAHCRFCAAAGRCAALREHARLVVAKGSRPELLTPEQIADSLPEVETVKLWARALEERALSLALSGTAIPGYKVVEGRSVRVISDPDRAVAALHKAGYDDNAILRPRELRSITELEKILGRKAMGALLGDYITKPQGKPSLAPDTDAREPWQPADYSGAFTD